MSLHRTGQRLFLLILAIFVISLVSVATTRSFSRQSLFEVAGVVQSGVDIEPLLSAVKESTALRMQEFKRVEIRDGKKVWEVKAKEAQYYTTEQLAHVNDAEVYIYRDNGSTVHFKSNAGKLYLSGETLIKAEFEGDIIVVIDNTTTLATNFAVYDALQNKLTAPGDVSISGDGFVIEGNEMDYLLNSQQFSLSHRVRSVFDPTSARKTNPLNLTKS